MTGAGVVVMLNGSVCSGGVTTGFERSAISSLGGGAGWPAGIGAGVLSSIVW